MSGGLPGSPLIQVRNPQVRTREEMRYMMDHRTAVSSRGAKVRWLRAHRGLWEGFLPNDRQTWRDIVKLMKADGLIAQSTHALDVSLPSLIADANLI